MPESTIGERVTYKMKAAETTLNQYCCAVLDTATEGQCIRPAGANAGNIVGVLLDATHAASTYATYQTTGVAKVKLGGNVSIGDLLVIGGVTGVAVSKGISTHTSGTGFIGRALRSGVSGDVIPVQLCIPNEFTS